MKIPSKSKRVVRSTSSEPYSPPGTLSVHPQSSHPRIRLMAYGPGNVREMEDCAVSEVSKHLGKSPVTWVHVQGLGCVRTVEELGSALGLHRLALEDVLNTHQRPKIEPYDDHVFLVARFAAMEPLLETEQISMFVGSNYVLTFQESLNPVFEPVFRRIAENRGQVRKMGADYLGYVLLDTVMDSYFPLVEELNDELDIIEDNLLAGNVQRDTKRIHAVRAHLHSVRRIVYPLRDAIHSVMSSHDSIFREETRYYLRDLYDHAFRLIDLVEVNREVCTDLMNLQIGMLNNRMSEIMKVLTIMASLFIPLTFIAGLYGMNFSPEASPWNMPELLWYYGYPFALCLMSVVAVGLLLYFRYKGWIGSSS